MTECLAYLETIEETQGTIADSMALIKLDTTHLTERADKTNDFQLYAILLMTIYFGYHISHYFLPKVKQLGGS